MRSQDVANQTKGNIVKKTKRRQRHSVAFDSKIKVNETLHLNDFTPEERDAYWHSKRDYTMIQEMIEITLHLLELGGEENDEEGVCFRGVQEVSLEGKLQHERRWNTAIDTVLSSQYYQHTRHFDNPEKIALNYDFQSFPCKQVAYDKGRRDELAIKDYLSE